MTNTSYLNLFPVRARRRPSDVQHVASAERTSGKESASESAPFSEDRVNRAFDLMGKWHSRGSASSSLELTALSR